MTPRQSFVKLASFFWSWLITCLMMSLTLCRASVLSVAALPTPSDQRGCWRRLASDPRHHWTSGTQSRLYVTARWRDNGVSRRLTIFLFLTGFTNSCTAKCLWMINIIDNKIPKYFIRVWAIFPILLCFCLFQCKRCWYEYHSYFCVSK